MNPEFYGPTGKQIVAPLIDAVSDFSPVLPAIGETLVNSILKNFDEGGRPDKWPESKRVQKKGGQTLVDTAVMKNSTNWQMNGKSGVTVGLSDEKAAWHNPTREFLMIQDEDYDFISDILQQHINRELGI